MKKVLIQGLFLVGIFLGSWLLLSQINWKKTLKNGQTRQVVNKKLGEIILKNFEGKIIKDKSVLHAVDSIKSRLCRKNKIDEKTIKIYIIKSEEINAFALPDRYLLLNSKLISECENEEALAGVIAHELAHISQNHVNKKLVKEIGAAVLASIMSNGGQNEVISQLIQVITSKAYDRGIESEADLLASNYLCKAGIDAKPFEDFLRKLNNNETSEAEKWLSTHPDHIERANTIELESKKCKTQSRKVLHESTWENLKQDI